MIKIMDKYLLVCCGAVNSFFLKVFANEYEDGVFEWGHFSYGTERFDFATVTGSKWARIVEYGNSLVL
jgi:hypothetical protein